MIRYCSLIEAPEIVSESPSTRWGITYTNKASFQFNNSVRQLQGKTNLVSEGDYLISTQTLYHTNITNGDRFIVSGLGNIVNVEEWVRGVEKKVRVRLQTFVLRNIDTDQEIEVLSCLENFESEKAFLTIQQKQALIIYRGKISENCLKRNEILFDPICNPASFKHSYSITAQRAQGSEIDDVVLMVRSLKELKRYPNGKNWIYTAATRAKKNLWICEDQRL